MSTSLGSLPYMVISNDNYCYRIEPPQTSHQYSSTRERSTNSAPTRLMCLHKVFFRLLFHVSLRPQLVREPVGRAASLMTLTIPKDSAKSFPPAGSAIDTRAVRDPSSDLFPLSACVGNDSRRIARSGHVGSSRLSQEGLLGLRL
jgi:hypothetical protein